MAYFGFAELIGSVPTLAHVAATTSPLQLIRAAACLHTQIPWKPSCKTMKERRISSALQSNTAEPLETTWLEMEAIFKQPIQVEDSRSGIYHLTILCSSQSKAVVNAQPSRKFPPATPRYTIVTYLECHSKANVHILKISI